MAARMQQHGEPYQINISQDTYNIIKSKFACIYRGKIDIKGKGEIDMYFVEREL
jgi:class 3 adenylate cyclase